MKRWKQSGVVRFFLLIVLSVSVLMDVLAGMYLFVGKEYALSGKRGGNDFFVSQEGTSRLLDGYLLSLIHI